MTGWWQQLEADIAGADRALEREHQTAITAGAPWPPRPEHAPQTSLTADPRPDGQAAEAAERLAANNADREARAEYGARIERETQAEPELTLQAQPSDQAEIEL